MDGQVRRRRLLDDQDDDPAYREDLLKVASGFSEEAQRSEESGILEDAATWWTYAGVLYAEAARVAHDDVSAEGHRAAAAACDRLARRANTHS